MSRYTEVCDTATTSTESVVRMYLQHRHCYGLVRVSANQHQRTEYRRCRCGDEIRLVTRWSERIVRWDET